MIQQLFNLILFFAMAVIKVSKNLYEESNTIEKYKILYNYSSGFRLGFGRLKGREPIG